MKKIKKIPYGKFGRIFANRGTREGTNMFDSEFLESLRVVISKDNPTKDDVKNVIASIRGDKSDRSLTRYFHKIKKLVEEAHKKFENM